MCENARRASIFIVYSHKDHKHLDDLKKHLAFLSLDCLADVFYDGRVDPGIEWEKRLIAELHRADIIVFLISADLMASRYIWEKEIPLAFTRQERSEALLIPILVREVEPANIFKERQLLRAYDGKSIATARDRDKAWTEIAQSAIRPKVDLINKMIQEKEIQRSRDIASPGAAERSVMMQYELHKELRETLLGASSIQLFSA